VVEAERASCQEEVASRQLCASLRSLSSGQDRTGTPEGRGGAVRSADAVTTKPRSKRAVLKLARRVPVLFLLGLVAGLAFQSLSIYIYLYPRSTVRQESFVLDGFGVAPWNTCCFYVNQTKMIFAPGDNLTDQVQIFYQYELPSDNSPPYFFLISACQLTPENSQAAFRDHVYMSLPVNVTKSLQQREITISYLIRDIRENGAHYFVLVPQIGPTILPQRMIVQGTVWRLVPDTSFGFTAQVLSLVSFATLGIEGFRLRKRH
jgi:hypothetical protein